jgi:hypothetical protein
MKKALCIAAAACALSMAMPASALIVGFTDVFAPGQWTVSFLGTLGGGSPNAGSVLQNSTTLTINGGNATAIPPGSDTPACVGGVYGFVGPCEVDVVTTHIMNPFSFQWSYVTNDNSGPGGDLFGVLVNGARIQLSDVGGPVSQSGQFTVNTATTSFGWYVNCTDCIGGAATASITNFRAGTVPEPATLWLTSLALMGLAFGRRSRG